MQQETSRKNLRISLGGTGDMKQYMSMRKKIQKEKKQKEREISWGNQAVSESTEKK